MSALKIQTRLIAAIAILAVSPLTAFTAEPVGELIIDSGSQNRPVSFVHFKLPEDWDSIPHTARTADGQIIPFQVDADGTGWLRVANTAANQQRKIQIYSGLSAAPLTGISARHVGNKVEMWSGAKRVLEYQAEPGEFPRSDIKEAFRRGGYLHPIWSPGGTIVTDDFPTNHVHHHGIWFPWTKTKFEEREPDFWNMGDEKGRVEFVNLDRFFSGPVFGGLNTQHRFVDLLADGGKTALNETWNVRVYAVPHDLKVSMFDLESTQTCATDSPLILPEYRYGGLGFRGRGDWDGKDNAHYLTSNGETDRIKGHATRADWCYIGGNTDGKRTGIVVMCHPDNFRAPQPMRIHPTEPFFCYAPQQLGEMAIEPEKPYVSKYRFLVLDGEPSVDQINEYWMDYSSPVKVTVVNRAKSN